MTSAAAIRGNAGDQERIISAFATSLNRATCFETPYRHWILRGVLPPDILNDIAALDLPVVDVGGLSGKREYHNDARNYFDAFNIAAHPCAAAIAAAYQSSFMVRLIEEFFDTGIDGTFLRIEYAQDKTGFWLEPHTDLGVKRLTLLLYISDSPEHDSLGTDIYDEEKSWVKRAPFEANCALAFVPGNATFHGFEKREIKGVRKSLIVNYVTAEWRDREQLCFPDRPVRRN